MREKIVRESILISALHVRICGGAYYLYAIQVLVYDERPRISSIMFIVVELASCPTIVSSELITRLKD